MSYSSELAKLIADQLSRFVTLNRHQLAGQVANLDFWLTQSRHALGVIDGYPQRFEQMRSAQNTYVNDHGTTEFHLGKAYPPRRVPDGELRDSRRELSDATYRFLVRCCNERLIAESRLRESCDSLGIGVEATDLKRRG